MKIVHIQTIVQTILGELDEEGNVIKKTPLQVEVLKLSDESFIEVVKKLKYKMQELEIAI